MDDNIVFRLEFEMGYVEIADGVQRRRNGAFALGAGARRAEFALHLPQCAQHASAIKALTFAVFTEAHTRIVVRSERRGVATATIAR